jgi:hypothetical protein
MKKRASASKLSIFIIMVIMTAVSSNLNWGDDNWKDIIEADGKGYYAYLPAVFIYHDLNFGFFQKIEQEKYYNKNIFYDYRSYSNGKTINKYYCGTAIAELPFFLVAHCLSHIYGNDTDGFSKLYTVFISVAALFYLFLGLIFLNNSLGLYNIKEWQKSLVLFASVFGTNLFYYTVSEPAMSHVFSFAFVSMFFYYSLKYFSSFQKKYIPALAITAAIIILIRPVNGLVFLIFPFAAGSYDNLKKGIAEFFHNKTMLIISAIMFLLIISLQFIIYKISTGSFFVYSYTEEGFDFFHPHFIDILFSYKKGLFLYTPLFLLSLTGTIYLWKSERFSFYSWFVFFIIVTYILSSWWCWYYGGSFSSRVYVEFIPFFMVLLAIALNKIKRKSVKITLITLIVLFTLLCQVQTYQYRYYQIHWSEMTKEKYWDVFLRIDKI